MSTRVIGMQAICDVNYTMPTHFSKVHHSKPLQTMNLGAASASSRLASAHHDGSNHPMLHDARPSSGACSVFSETEAERAYLLQKRS